MSAITIIETAPLGALIRYTCGRLKPPTRFTKKLAVPAHTNRVGHIVKKEPPAFSDLNGSRVIHAA